MAESQIEQVRQLVCPADVNEALRLGSDIGVLALAAGLALFGVASFIAIAAMSRGK